MASSGAADAAAAVDLVLVGVLLLLVLGLSGVRRVARGMAMALGIAQRLWRASRRTQPLPSGDEPGLLRIGVLGAATIAKPALVVPASRVANVQVRAVAARDPERAAQWARRNSVPVVHDTYEALLADPDIDAVYNPLPNGLHHEWTIKALQAGKHVLCEKPFASTAAQAEEMARVAKQTGLHLVEAFHYRYHPMIRRVKDIVDSGELGDLVHIHASMKLPRLAISKGDIRYNFELGGGSAMDCCYAVNVVRYLSSDEPVVESAEATMTPGSTTVDEAMSASCVLPKSSATATIETSFVHGLIPDIAATVTGTRGRVTANTFIIPFIIHSIVVEPIDNTGSDRESDDVDRVVRRVEHAYDRDGRSTYDLQLEAFAHTVATGDTAATDCTNTQEAVATMRVLDAIYEAAGLPPRGSPKPRP